MKPRDGRGSALSPGELLDAVPVRNSEAVSEREEDGETVVAVPLRRRWYMRPPLSWVMPFSSHRRVQLDRFGTEVWRGCDGRNTTETIVERFATTHHLSFHEARLSVMQFLRELVRRGLVVMAGQPTREGHSEAH
jgi:hypothetical protein